MDDKNNDRPALETAIDVTPEMIEAGITALNRYDAFVSLSPTIEELLVRDVLAAGLKAASEGNIGTP